MVMISEYQGSRTAYVSRMQQLPRLQRASPRVTFAAANLRCYEVAPRYTRSQAVFSRSRLRRIPLNDEVPDLFHLAQPKLLRIRLLG